MFSDFYQIPEQPFGTSPNPDYLYNSPAHSRTLTGLLENLASKKFVQTLTASPGCGKTTILYALRKRLGPEFRSVFISYTLSTTENMIDLINRELGVGSQDPDAGHRPVSLQRFFVERKRSAARIVIIIDEAQNLSANTLEELGSLLASIPGSPGLIVSGHSGSTDLLDTIRRTTLHPHVSASHELTPLDPDHTAHYVRHRMRVSGYTGPELFTGAALERIAAESKGIPRNINTVCFHALIHGTAARKREIDVEVIEEVLPKCAFLGLSRPLVRESTPERQNTKLAEMLRGWLSVRWGAWSGTAGELYQQLRSAHPIGSDAILSAAELRADIGGHSAALRSAGVNVELRRRPGQPERLVLTLRDGHVNSGQAA